MNNLPTYVTIYLYKVCGPASKQLLTYKKTTAIFLAAFEGCALKKIEWYLNCI